jgi:hypothetical protein
LYFRKSYFSAKATLSSSGRDFIYPFQPVDHPTSDAIHMRAEGVEMDLFAMKARFHELIGLDPDKGIPLKETLLKYHMADETASLRFPGGYQ